MRKKDDKLRERLLDLARKIADTEGVEEINIRSLAKRAGVASGTVYNYFSNKDEILLALTEEYWKQTLFEMEEAIVSDSFCKRLEEIFAFLKGRLGRSTGKLMNNLGSARAPGLERMAAAQLELKAILLRYIEEDTSIRGDIWDENFTKEGLAEFIMMNIMAVLKAREPDICILITIISRIVY